MRAHVGRRRKGKSEKCRLAFYPQKTPQINSLPCLRERRFAAGRSNRVCVITAEIRENWPELYGGLSHGETLPHSLNGWKGPRHRKLCLRTVSGAAQRAKFDLNPRTGGRSGFGPTQSECPSRHTVIKKALRYIMCFHSDFSNGKD